MTSLGDTLRRARLKRNLELNRIADELKISASMLKAIEDERFDKLPGGVFARSFVRQYARLLELDEDEIVGELRRVLEVGTEAPPPQVTAHLPESEIPLPRVRGWQAVGDRGVRSSSLVAFGLVVVAMLACAGAYEWWERAHRPPVARASAALQTAKASPPPAPIAKPAPVATPPPAEPAPQRAEAAPPKPATEETSSPAAPQVTTDEPAAPEASAAALPAETNPDAAVRVEVTTTEDVWISVRADGQFSFSGVIGANQTRTLAANKTIWLKVGNAGGVTISLNGKPIGPLGGEGVVRTLQLTSGGFKIVPPDLPKPAAPPTDSTDPL